MIIKKLGWFSMVLLLLVWGCNDCEECVTTVDAPRVSFVFLNQTSLDTLNTDLGAIDASLTELQTMATSLTASNVTLDSLLDSLTARIARGMIELRDDSMATANKIEANNQLLTSNAESQNSLNTERSDLTSIIATVESGNLLVDTVTNIETGTFQTFADSATAYKLPLDPNNAAISYAFSIASMEYDLTVTYTTSTSQSARRNILVGAENIAYTTTSFDSVRVDPETNNTNATTTIYCSF
ncbi:MAG: hypothetical protein R8G66_08365 [Cytophagales bacterium]|nr:hypothetical protein [Cytophagales bacterium]